jgi:NADPH:quinone reductase-like Zn-dependent oxidoreductase
MQTIRALVKTEPGVGLKLQEIPLPELRPNHVRIRLQLSAAHQSTDLEAALAAFRQVGIELGLLE